MELTIESYRLSQLPKVRVSDLTVTTTDGDSGLTPKALQAIRRELISLVNNLPPELLTEEKQ